MDDSKNEVKRRLSVAPNIGKQILCYLQWDFQSDVYIFFLFVFIYLI
jgi:hypothetical protein